MMRLYAADISPRYAACYFDAFDIRLVHAALRATFALEFSRHATIILALRGYCRYAALCCAHVAYTSSPIARYAAPPSLMPLTPAAATALFFANIDNTNNTYTIMPRFADFSPCMLAFATRFCCYAAAMLFVCLRMLLERHYATPPLDDVRRRAMSHAVCYADYCAFRFSMPPCRRLPPPA